MTEKITLELTLNELKLIDKYVEYNEETKEVFGKIKSAYLQKPQTLYDLIWEEVGKKVGYGIDCDVMTDRLVDIVEEWLPKEQSAAGSQNVYVECTVEGYNDCLKEMKEMLR